MRENIIKNINSICISLSSSPILKIQIKLWSINTAFVSILWFTKFIHSFTHGGVKYFLMKFFSSCKLNVCREEKKGKFELTLNHFF